MFDIWRKQTHKHPSSAGQHCLTQWYISSSKCTCRTKSPSFISKCSFLFACLCHPPHWLTWLTWLTGGSLLTPSSDITGVQIPGVNTGGAPQWWSVVHTHTVTAPTTNPLHSPTPPSCFNTTRLLWGINQSLAVKFLVWKSLLQLFPKIADLPQWG